MDTHSTHSLIHPRSNLLLHIPYRQKARSQGDDNIIGCLGREMQGRLPTFQILVEATMPKMPCSILPMNSRPNRTNTRVVLCYGPCLKFHTCELSPKQIQHKSAFQGPSMLKIPPVSSLWTTVNYRLNRAIIRVPQKPEAAPPPVDFQPTITRRPVHQQREIFIKTWLLDYLCLQTGITNPFGGMVHTVFSEGEW